MKKSIHTFTLIIGGLLLAGSMGAMASAPAHAQKAAKENVRREIIRSISCPDFVTENNEANDVKALVSVDESGHINLHEINSANPELKSYVIKMLKEMKMKDTTPTGKFVLVVKFRVA